MRMHKPSCGNQNPVKNLPGWPWFSDNTECLVCKEGNPVYDIPSNVIEACDVLSRGMLSAGPTPDAITLAEAQRVLIKLAHMGKME